MAAYAERKLEFPLQLMAARHARTCEYFTRIGCSILYFVVMFSVALVTAKLSGMNYAQAAAVSFTAAGNNFELNITTK